LDAAPNQLLLLLLLPLLVLILIPQLLQQLRPAVVPCAY
jgi:hypothetical protein